MSTDSVRRSRAFRLALAVTLGAILSGTLFPSGGEKPAPMLDCLVCGERGVAAIITNIILFLPLGALLELAGWRLSQSVWLQQRCRPRSNSPNFSSLGGTRAGRGWSIVFYPEHLPGWLMRLLDVGWLVGLWFPVGLCARRRPALWAVGSLLAGLALAPALTGVLATPVPEWLGGVAGALAGIRTRSLVSRYVGRGQRESARENRAATSASTHRSMRP